LFSNSGNGVQCVLCISSCRSCATNQPGLCLSCGIGFYLLGTSCISCSSNCQACSSLGCTSCVSGYYINSGLCAPNCKLPCSTCSTSDTSSCRSCIAGYSYSNTSFTCNPITSCNGSCSVCPLGYSLQEGSCFKCSTNCGSCFASSPEQCTGCLQGYYLSSNSQCVKCPSSCATCAFSTGCITCALGYTFLANTPQTNNIQCLACTSPCATCQYNTNQCITCINGFALQGWKCTKTFYFYFNMTLNTNMETFNQNYLSFLQALANSF
jgi:hypothetical protein